MDDNRRKAVKAAQAKRQQDLRQRVAKRQAQNTCARPSPAVPPNEEPEADVPVIETPDSIDVPETAPQRREPDPVPPAPATVVADYMQLYLEAQDEFERQKQRLVERRGGEDQLTDADHTTLENLRDLLLMWQESYLVR